MQKLDLSTNQCLLFHHLLNSFASLPRHVLKLKISTYMHGEEYNKLEDQYSSILIFITHRLLRRLLISHLLMCIHGTQTKFIN